jgi:elongation factor Ts
MQAYLKKKGLASAGKKAGRIAAEGVIETYIHVGASLGVLIEVNCETDFVAKGEQFKELAANLAMQVAANPDVQYVSADDVPQSFKDAEMAMESKREDLEGKPEKARESIIQGRVNKTVRQMCLLDQDYIRENSKTVETVIKEAIAAMGENIRVRRFTRFNLGEGIEKRQDDFAAEVAAQTGQA